MPEVAAVRGAYGCVAIAGRDVLLASQKREELMASPLRGYGARQSAKSSTFVRRIEPGATRTCGCCRSKALAALAIAIGAVRQMLLYAAAVAGFLDKLAFCYANKNARIIVAALASITLTPVNGVCG